MSLEICKFPGKATWLEFLFTQCKSAMRMTLYVLLCVPHFCKFLRHPVFHLFLSKITKNLMPVQNLTMKMSKTSLMAGQNLHLETFSGALWQGSSTENEQNL